MFEKLKFDIVYESMYFRGNFSFMPMLLEFSVSNYRSLGERQVLSLSPASNQKDYPENVLGSGKKKALNVIAIYGANGSGKSNILKSFVVFRYVIGSSMKWGSNEKLPYDPFWLRDGWDSKPTQFEIIFEIDGLRYRYGYSYVRERIEKEWLFRKGAGREVHLFLREGDIIDNSSSLQGHKTIIHTAIEATRENALFLSTLDAFNIDEAKKVIKGIGHQLVVDGTKSDSFAYNAITWSNPTIKKNIVEHLKSLKLGMVDIDARKKDGETDETEEQYQILSHHIHYGKDAEPTGDHIIWDFLDRESSGSIKALEIAGPIVAALAVGEVITIDEIEANMHPLLTLHMIDLFLNKETNPRGAQLIFSTHDTNLLKYANLRRDQIYFAEKNKWESTEIYSLSDFVYVDDITGTESKERPDTDKEKRYIEGRYGAIPVFGPLAYLKREENGEKGKAQ